ncbi:MAG: DUF1045 domain-containing protein [Gammaproteobacteria bacterium]|nr:DUF1045 domain-containing protein [Gammaproteobacteria bacterium]MBU1414270.1 DUF1045 domain-containing protein [Gammaproteobacteria bacterium]
MPAEARYAIYFAPQEDSAFAMAGSRWLGRDAIGDTPLAQPKCPGLTSARLAELTGSARRYGFHATLKPPFHLRDERALPDLRRAIAALATRQQAFSFHVQVASLSGFLAWLPTAEVDAIEAVARACVTELDDFRQAPTVAELVRRQSVGLNKTQEALLLRWGYPYVLEEFRFHMTLTDTVSGAEARALLAALEAGAAGHALEAIPFDSLCLFGEPAPGANFRMISRYGFDGSVKHYPGWHE